MTNNDIIEIEVKYFNFHRNCSNIIRLQNKLQLNFRSTKIYQEKCFAVNLTKHDSNEQQGVMKIKPNCTKSSQNQLASSVRKTDRADASEMQNLLGKETKIDLVSTQNVKRKVT